MWAVGTAVNTQLFCSTVPEIPQCERKNMNQVYIPATAVSDDEDRERDRPFKVIILFYTLVMTPATLLET